MSEQDGKRDIEEQRRKWLLQFLRELVREQGRMEAVQLLEVNYQTLVKAEESGELTGRMIHALERLLLSRDGPDGEERREYRQLERRVAALEEAVKELRRELRAGRLAGGASGASDDAASPVVEPAQGTAVDAGPTETGADPPVEGLAVNPQPRPPSRKYPELVTMEPADDDPGVYGDAWPLVREYRKLREGHPRVGKGLSWLTVEEKLLTVELALLEEHELTLPPARYPAMGLDRRSHTRWRWKALANTRKALARRIVLRWLRRLLNLGAWWLSLRWRRRRRAGSKRRASDHRRGGSGACKIRSLRRQRGR